MSTNVYHTDHDMTHGILNLIQGLDNMENHLPRMIQIRCDTYVTQDVTKIALERIGFLT